MDLQQSIKAYAKLMGISEAEAKQDAEATIQLWMKQDHYSREFAEASWIEDQEDASAQELNDMDKRAKANGTTKVKARKVPNYSLENKPKRERKPNDEKRILIAAISSKLEDVEDITIVNPEREITFRVGNNNYSLTLTCHRKSKG